MKTFAHHDAEGNIHALVTVSGEKMAMLTPKAGHFVTQIDHSESMDVEAVWKMAKGMKIPVPRVSGSKKKG
jgi:hypothetical protein